MKNTPFVHYHAFCMTLNRAYCTFSSTQTYLLSVSLHICAALLVHDTCSFDNETERAKLKYLFSYFIIGLSKFAM